MGKTHLGQTAAALKRKGTAKDFALAHEWQAQTKRQAQQASGPLRQSPCTGGTTAQIRKIEEAAGFRQDSATPASNSGAGEEIRKLQDSIFKDRETLYGAIVPNSSEHHGAGVHIRQPIRSPRKPLGCPPAPAPALERPDQEGSQPISQATHRPLSSHYQAIIRPLSGMDRNSAPSKKANWEYADGPSTDCQRAHMHTADSSATS